MNLSYSVNLITPLPRIFLRFIYRVLTPPAHHTDLPHHTLRFHAHCIDGSEGYPLQYGRLPPLNVHSDGVDPRGGHRLIYR